MNFPWFLMSLTCQTTTTITISSLTQIFTLKNWLFGKDPDAEEDWRQEEEGTTEDEMVAWHHWCDGHEFEQAPGVGDGQGSLACYSPWDRKESDMTEELNWTDWTVTNLAWIFHDFWCFYCCQTTTMITFFFNAPNPLHAQSPLPTTGF